MRALEVCAEAAGGDLAEGAVAMADGVLGGTGGEDLIRPPVEVVVRVSAEDLSGETGLGDGFSAETSRRLLCDAGVVPVLEDGAGRIIDVGRKRRTISAALRRALATRDGGCRFPGCSNRRYIDGHHVQHWAHGGETSLANCLQMCRRHHVAVHEGGFWVELVDGEAQFFDPTGRRISEVGERPVVRPELLESWLGEEGVEVTSETNAGWDGTPIDYGLAWRRLRPELPSSAARPVSAYCHSLHQDLSITPGAPRPDRSFAGSSCRRSIVNLVAGRRPGREVRSPVARTQRFLPAGGQAVGMLCRAPLALRPGPWHG
jgi:hypothetical protein